MIRFALAEGWRAFKNLGVAGLLTLTSLTVTLTLIGLFLNGHLILNEWSRGLLGRFEMEAFLDPNAAETQVNQIAARIREIPEVKSIRIISKDEAAQRFKDSFGGELFDLVQNNPLPPSIVVTLRRPSDSATGWSQLAAQLRNINGVRDVVYQGELLSQVHAFYQRAATIAGLLTFIALAFSLLLTWITVGGAIRARDEFIRVIVFSGGTRGTARAPFIALGGYYGLFSGILASGIVWGISWLVTLGWGIKWERPVWTFPALVAGGLLVTAFASAIVAGRRIRKV